jgi:hypothetical protein
MRAPTSWSPVSTARLRGGQSIARQQWQGFDKVVCRSLKLMIPTSAAGLRNTQVRGRQANCAILSIADVISFRIALVTKACSTLTENIAAIESETRADEASRG